MNNGNCFIDDSIAAPEGTPIEPDAALRRAVFGIGSDGLVVAEISKEEWESYRCIK